MSYDTTLKIYSSNYDNDDKFLVLNYREKNKSTSLTLHGPDAFNFGNDYLTNLYHLTENFCDNTGPSLPIQGQKFYNSETKSIHVYDEVWSEIVVTPNTDTLDVVYDKLNTSIHNTRVLSNDLKSYISLDGNTKPCTITLIDVEPTIDNQAVPKKYATGLITNTREYLPKTGTATMTGPLMLMDVEDSYPGPALANVQYVNTLGTLQTVSDHTTPAEFRVTKYTTPGRKIGTEFTRSQIFCTVWFNTTIASGSSSVTVTLPNIRYSEIEDTSVDHEAYNYHMSVTCNTVGEYKKLHVSIVDGNSFTISRSGTTGATNVCGNVYGFINKY